MQRQILLRTDAYARKHTLRHKHDYVDYQQIFRHRRYRTQKRISCIMHIQFFLYQLIYKNTQKLSIPAFIGGNFYYFYLIITFLEIFSPSIWQQKAIFIILFITLLLTFYYQPKIFGYKCLR